MGAFLEFSIGTRVAVTTNPDVYEIGIEFAWWVEPVAENNACGVYFGNYFKVRPVPFGFMKRFYLLGDLQHWVLHYGGSSFSVVGMGLGYHYNETEQQLKKQGLTGWYVELSVQIPFEDSQHPRYKFIPTLVGGFYFE